MKLTRAGGIALALIGTLAGLLCISKFRSIESSRTDAVDETIEKVPASGTFISEPVPLDNAVLRAALTDDAFEALLQSRPGAAAEEVAALPEATDLRDARLARLMEVWAESAPHDAANWANGLPNGAFRDEAMQELAAAWGNLDPDATAEWARQELTSGRIVPASALLSVWGRQDAERAGEWLRALSDSEDMDTATLARLSGALAYAWATSAPLAAADWVIAQEDPNIRGKAIINLAAGWAETDPDALAVWLGVHVPPDAAEAEPAYVALAAHWADTRPDAAGRWAASLPAGDLRDTTLATFASSLGMSQPASALEWSRSIAAEDLRLEAALDIYETWLDDDLATARAAIVAAIPYISERSHQHALYNLLHEKDPVFRDELYDLVLPEVDPDATDGTSDSETAPPSAPASRQQPPEPEIRRALPVTEEDVDVEAMAQ